MTKLPYSRAQKLLHWVSAAVILWALITGFYAALAPVSLQSRAWIGWMNVSLTTLLIPLFLWRCVLACKHYKAAGAEPPSRMTRLAGGVHVALYLLISVVLVTGVLMMQRAIVVFDWFTLPQPLSNPSLIAFFHTLHIASCAALAVLVALHIAAVAKHALQGRSVLGRML